MAEYVEITWDDGETITREDLVSLTNNQDYIRNNTPRLRFTVGANRDEGNKMIVGTATKAGSTATTVKIEVKFGEYFNSDCNPVCITQLRSTDETKMYGMRTTGLDGTIGIKSDGFIVLGNNWTGSGKSKNKMSTIWVDWVAYGW